MADKRRGSNSQKISFDTLRSKTISIFLANMKQDISMTELTMTLDTVYEHLHLLEGTGSGFAFPFVPLSLFCTQLNSCNRKFLVRNSYRTRMHEQSHMQHDPTQHFTFIFSETRRQSSKLLTRLVWVGSCINQKGGRKKLSGRLLDRLRPRC